MHQMTGLARNDLARRLFSLQSIRREWIRLCREM